tara:strand:- start:17436 stop:18683 length:1248 start_codon:yes stop_codon:yes gene_type:complete
MKFLLVSNSPIQNSSYEKFFKDRNIKFQSVSGETISPYIKKNATNLSFLSQIQRAIFFGNNSFNSYSYYHSAFKVKRSETMIFNLCLKFFSYFGRYFPNFSKKILLIFDQIRLRISNKLNEQFDAVIFSGIFSTKDELNYFYRAKKSKIPCIYSPYNWDNPSSKLYIPSIGFDKTISWGKQMTDYLKKSENNFGNLVESFPLRLEYLNEIKKDRNLFKSKKILIALSQKDNKELLNMFSELSCLEKSDQIEQVILRPHPQNSLKSEDIKKILGISKIFKLDSSYEEVLGRRESNIIPMTDNIFRENSLISLKKSLKDIDLLICEAGTLCLEAGYLEIPVIGLMNNPFQVTASMYGHFDHFKDLTTMPWFKPIFSISNIDKVVLNFIDSFESKYTNNFKDLSYFLSTESLNEKSLL